MGDCQNDDLRLGFDRRLKLKFLGSKVTTDAGLLAYRELAKACCRCRVKTINIDSNGQFLLKGKDAEVVGEPFDGG